MFHDPWYKTFFLYTGHDGKPAPKLKDAALSFEELEIAYDETIEMMKTLYNRCHLVHADLRWELIA